MGQFIQPSDVPAIDDVEARQLIADVEADALSRIPELASLASMVPANLLGTFRRIVMRWHIEGPAALTQIVQGPYQTGLDAPTRIGWELSEADLADLRRAAGVTAPERGTPRGSFPDDTISSIFEPRRFPCA